LLTHSKIRPAMLLYRKFSTFTGFNWPAVSEFIPASDLPRMFHTVSIELMPEPSHFAITTDGGVVLDLKHDRLLKLNTVGTEMWTLLSRGMSETQVVEEIAHRYGVDQLRVGADLRALLRRGEQMGLFPESALIAKPTEPSPLTEKKQSLVGGEQDQVALRAVPTSDVVRAILGLGLFDIILSCRSLNGLFSVVKSWPVSRLRAAGESTVIRQILRAVEKASVWYPKKALCLQRSAVTTCLLRERGIRASMVVGVRPMPFLAHAWVEVEGRVVNDFPRVKIFYQSLSSY
jgi:hypothetical protein